MMLPLLAVLAALQSPALPDARIPISAAWDERRNQLVIAGGYRPDLPLAATWTYDSAWHAAGNHGLSGRDEPLMAYHPVRGRIVLYGGDRQGRLLGDSWEWDGERWHMLDSAGPLLRASGMAWHARRQRLVLFGGVVSPERPEPNDLWEWTGQRWVLLARGDSLGPPGRVLHGWAYDEARDRLVLMGGAQVRGGRPVVFDDTWEWDGARWSRVGGPGPGARDHVWMTWDPLRRAIVLHGGAHPETGMKGDTWVFDGAWRLLFADGPRRARHRLVFDTRRGALLMYGGWEPGRRTNTLWQLGAAGWEPLHPQ